MKKIFLSLSIILISLLTVGVGYGLFRDTVVVADNIFYSAGFSLELSETDDDNDKIGDLLGTNWSKETVGTWASGTEWVPGEAVSSKIFLRSNSRIDAESVLFTIDNRKYTGEAHLDEVIQITEAWYDRNANGLLDTGEDLLPEFTTAYDTDGQGLTLAELYDGLDEVHNGQAFDLEAGTAVLPGSLTDNVIGGNAGTGKGFFITWQYDPQADLSYQGSTLSFNLVFTAEQSTD